MAAGTLASDEALDARRQKLSGGSGQIGQGAVTDRQAREEADRQAREEVKLPPREETELKYQKTRVRSALHQAIAAAQTEKPAQARDRFAALVPRLEQVLGPKDPDTLEGRVQLANWTGEAGDAAGARDQYAALLAVRGRVSGPDHPDTLAIRDNLAHWTRKAEGDT